MSEPLPNVFDWLQPQKKPEPLAGLGGTFTVPTTTEPSLPNVFDWLAKDLGKKPAVAPSGQLNAAEGAPDFSDVIGGRDIKKRKPGEPLEPGNIDLYSRPHVQNPDGSVSTVRSMSFGTDKGEVLVPTISDDGRTLTPEEAIALYHATGKHLGVFATPDEATAYGKRLHDDFAAGKYAKGEAAAGAKPQARSVAFGVGGGTSSTAPWAPPVEHAPLARGRDEEAMAAALGQTGIVGAAGEGAAAALPETIAWAAKINRLGGIPLRAAAELVPGTELGGRLRSYAEDVEDWAQKGQKDAEALAAQHALSTEAGLPAQIVHGAVAGAGPMALGMTASALTGPAGAAATFGTGGLAATYTDALDRGVPRLQALIAAVPRGIAEGILAKGLPAAQTENLLAKALTKEAAKAAAAEAAARVTLADAGAAAAHGAATMTGFEALGQMGEIATGHQISLGEQAQRDFSAALTGGVMSGALPARQALENKVEIERLRGGVRTPAEQRAARVPRVMTEEELNALSQADATIKAAAAGPAETADRQGGQAKVLRQRITERVAQEHGTPRDAREAKAHQALIDSEVKQRIDPLTGLPNRVALDEGPRKPVIALSDLDGLKAVNDEFGHELGGNKLIEAMAQVAERLGMTTHRLHGDEFAHQFDTQEEADKGMAALRDALDQVVIDFKTPDGRTGQKKGVGFGYGLSTSGHPDLKTVIDEADVGLKADKDARAAAGLRTPRESKPGPTAESARPAEGNGVHEGNAAVGTPGPEGGEPAAPGVQGEAQPAVAPKGKKAKAAAAPAEPAPAEPKEEAPPPDPAADAKRLTDDVTELHDPTSHVTSPENAGFYEAFVHSVPSEERGTLIGPDGNHTAAGVERLEAAMRAKGIEPAKGAEPAPEPVKATPAEPAKAAPEPAPEPEEAPEPEAEPTASQKLTAHQATKPSSLAKRFGKNGPTPEQLVRYTAELKAWNSENRRLKKAADAERAASNAPRSAAPEEPTPPSEQDPEQADPHNYRLPEETSKMAPRFGHGSRNFKLEFASDFDRATYTLANSLTTSKRHADILADLKAKTGLSEQELTDHGNQVKDSIRKKAAAAPEGDEVLSVSQHDLNATDRDFSNRLEGGGGPEKPPRGRKGRKGTSGFLSFGWAKPKPSGQVELSEGMRGMVKKWLRSGGVLPKTALAIMERSKGRGNNMRDTIVERAQNLSKAIGDDEVLKRRTLNYMLDETKMRAARGKLLPAHVRTMADEMIAHLEDLQQKVIDEPGLLNDKMRETFLARKGKHLVRGYAVHVDPKHWKRLKADKAAMDSLRAEFRALPEYAKMSDGQINAQIEHLARNPDSFDPFSSGGAETLETGMFRRRQEIAAPIRKAMGEFEDPALQYYVTAQRLSRNLRVFQMYGELRDLGKAEGWLKAEHEMESGLTTKIPGSNTRRPLAGLHTSDYIAEALAGADGEVEHGFWRGLTAWTGLSKKGKTVWDPQTQSRNFEANILFSAASGNGFASRLPLIEKLRIQRMPWDKHVQPISGSRATELGVQGTQLDLGDINRMRGTREWGLPRKGLAAADRALTSLYKLGDDYPKRKALERETAKQIWIASKPGETITPEARRAAEERAASIIKDVLPNYDRLNLLLKKVRANPATGTFLGFPAEVIRTFKNIAGQGYTELKSSNAREKMVGAHRLASLAAVLAVPNAIGAGAKAIYNHRKTKEAPEYDDAVKAARSIAPPYMKNSDIKILSAPGDGTATVVDMSFADPFGQFRRIWNAASAGAAAGDKKGGTQRILDAIQEAGDPYVGEGIGTSELIDVARNTQRQTGAKVYTEGATKFSQAYDIAKHIAGAVQPGFVAKGIRIGKAITGTQDSTYRKYELGPEIGAVFGPRVMKLDSRSSLHFAPQKFADLTQSSAALKNKSENETLSAFERKRLAADADATLKLAARNLYEVVSGAKGLGLSEDDIREILGKERISDAYIEASFEGSQAIIDAFNEKHDDGDEE